MRILVTGATGFVGKHVCAWLEEEQHDVVRLDFRTGQVAFGAVDQIWHLAAWTQAGDFCLKRPAEQWDINQDLNRQTLKFWREHHPQAKFISFGTSCAYDPRLPMTEGNYLEGKPTDDLMAYAMSKRMLQVGVEAMGQQYGMKWLTIVPSTIYGPDYHKDGRQLHFIYDLVRKILSAKRTGEPAVLWGDGTQVRQLVHVKDLLDLVITMSLDHEGIYNIGNVTASIAEFAGMICSLVDYDPALIQYDPNGYAGTQRKVLKSRKLYDACIRPSWTTVWAGLEQIIAEMSE